MSKHQTKSEVLSRRPTRVPDGPCAMFGGELVNGEMLRKKYLNGIPEAALEKLIRQGMPRVRPPGSARNWFRPLACLEWFIKHEQQLNQPRLRRVAKR
jgi:hypothetical protein